MLTTHLASAELYDPANFAPEAQPSSITMAEDTSSSFAMQVTDPDRDPLTAVVVSGPMSGTLSVSGLDLTYTPAPDFNGGDSFTLKAHDGALDSNTVTVTLTVTPVNDRAQAQDVALTTTEDTPVQVTLLGTDADGDALTYSVASQPRFGRLSGTPPDLTYTPFGDQHGTDTFDFEVVDDSVFFSRGTVTITVTPVNDLPLAMDSVWNTVEETPVMVKLIAVDPDHEQQLTYTVVSGPSHGTLSGTAPELLYTPNADFSGTDTFSFKASDGEVETTVATTTIQVAPVNDAPVADDQSLGTRQGQALQLVLSATDTDGDTLTYTVVSDPLHGTLSGTAPDLTYTPSEGFSGADSFTFKATDGQQDSRVATISISVTQEAPPPPTDPPVDPPGGGCGCSGASGGGWPFWGGLLLLGALMRISRPTRTAPCARPTPAAARARPAAD